MNALVFLYKRVLNHALAGRERLQLLEWEFAFSKFSVEILGGKVAASIASVPAARHAEVSAVAEVARGRMPFQNWVEPSIRRQGQLEREIDRVPTPARLLVTTRNSKVIVGLEGDEHRVDVLSLAGAF
jgi:hypothetical protein